MKWRNYFDLRENLIHLFLSLGILAVQVSVHRSISSRNCVAWFEMWIQSGEGGQPYQTKYAMVGRVSN